MYFRVLICFVYVSCIYKISCFRVSGQSLLIINQIPDTLIFYNQNNAFFVVFHYYIIILNYCFKKYEYAAMLSANTVIINLERAKMKAGKPFAEFVLRKYLHMDVFST